MAQKCSIWGLKTWSQCGRAHLDPHPQIWNLASRLPQNCLVHPGTTEVNGKMHVSFDLEHSSGAVILSTIECMES